MLITLNTGVLAATDPGGTNELRYFKVIYILVRPLPEATE